MKLDVEVNEIVLSNVGTTGEFRIRNSAKAFKILSDGLYSNKIRAIIRELSCNAVDSHVGAGKEDVPFEVHLPSTLEPWFSVRDFGLGLDGDQVTNIYTTYFESTKTDSNDYIGALGLGSKSPFSYTENFTVTAIKNGTQRIYSAFINEMGVPSIAQMSEELTDEGNGVEVKFSVTERYDYNSFKFESDEVFKWFKNKPKVTGAHFTHTSPDYKEQNIVSGVSVLNGTHLSFALMGNIAYPLNKISEPVKHFGELAELLNCGLLIEFGIGELDFAASREELSYVPMTIRSIKRKLEELNANLTLHFSAKADAIVDEWERAEYLYEESRSKLYLSAVKKYVADTKFALYDPTAYYGKKNFKFTVKDLTARGITITAFQIYSGSVRGKIGKSNDYVGGTYVESMSIPVDSSVVIVLNDLKTGCDARARFHFVNHFNNKSCSVYCISHSSEDNAVRQVEYDKLIKELHNPPYVVNASAMEKRIPKKRDPLTNAGIAVLVEKENNSRWNAATEYKWVPETDEISDTKIYYFVCLNNHNPETLDGKYFNIVALKAQMAKCGVDDIKNITVHGVRKSRLKELKDRPNWIWVEEKIKEETAKVSDAHVRGMVAAGILDHYSVRAYTNAMIANKVKPTSDYAKFAKACNSIKRATGEVAELTTLCGAYGKSVQVEAVKKELEDAKKLIMAKYPLIKNLSGADDKDVADYINMVDKQ
jgi:hypothetical protein